MPTASTDSADRPVRIPRAAVRATVAATLRPVLSPRVPIRRQRALLDLNRHTLPLPPATRRTRTTLGGVPAERVEHPGAATGRTVLYLHGGGYIVGSADSHRAVAAQLSRTARAPVQLLGYRLAPEHPYPAAVEDAVAAYRALLDAGYRAEHVAIAGDSAGAGLALAATLRLRAAGDPLPAALALISPWTDLTLSGASITANEGRDALLRGDWLRLAVACYRGPADPADPELSPLHAELAGLPPLHVVAGVDELLASDADRLVERARAAGVDAAYRRAERMWHDYPLLAGLLAEADDAVSELGAALRQRWGDTRPTVAVIGAGFAGIGMGIALARAGIRDFTIFDKADGIGGVWRDNTYPGAACDVPSHLYSYSFAPRDDWPKRFSEQPDILDYLRRCVRDHDLDGHLRLGTEVRSAEFDEARGRWRLALGSGEVTEAEVLVPACGQLSVPSDASIKGMGSFRGTAFHSARWDHDHDLTGKRVGVIGTGASAIQFVPAIAPRVGSMAIFQRSAPYVIPKVDRSYRRWHHWMFRRLPASRLAARAGFWAFFEMGALGLTSLRPARVPFTLAYRALRRLQVPDPELREALTPGYEIGCKRILISSDFYPALRRDNVSVVTSPVEEVTPDGVRTADGTEHAVDTIILGTGFATNDFLAPMQVRGTGGRDLDEAWHDGARAYLGMTVPGFPNMFMLYGPNTNLGSGSIIYMLESQIRYVVDAVEALGAAGGTGRLEVRDDVESGYDSELQQRLDGSVWATCASWYRTDSGRITNNWPGRMREYRRRTRALDLADYRAAASG
jgi:cation diffusion facilitator CzcD-associated flavoprotein CzcO/acetyl esterase/lipase